MISRTSIKTSPHLTRIVNQNLLSSTAEPSSSQIELLFKCENLQYTGSFKFRGACHFLAKLDDQDLKNGVVAYSTGNHAQAVAHAAQLASKTRNKPIPSYVVVPSDCPPKKIAAARSHGAAVLLSGTDPNARVLLAEHIQRATGAVLVPPADHLDIVLGQATAVHEFLQQAAQAGRPLDAIIVPSGGGGLLCGAIATCKPRGVAVFGCEPEVGGPGLATALERGRRSLEIQGPGSIADGLRSLTGEANWEHICAEGNVKHVLTVGEVQIEEALRVGVRELGFAVEPSAAVPLAAALFSDAFHRWVADADRRVRVGVVLTGGNVSMEDLAALVPGF
ncbi:tryptophan synthase beta subunit-like PLP-dependent enzyme [Karstenula rhodostoma CBS 690.94]|uniref:Tryptophan synthase beta subunit-like PLP-dependent enzyme n=1 Tax=Karstenula rhodostoma CBS 690.94 TaxID=1392251 RepID=A0A9P4UAL0_9PLEO|nr:tryptophan synthase beta subunit-like PLP-dependent enzyme [Karstenula rhodostoma CBS 690.94]